MTYLNLHFMRSRSCLLFLAGILILVFMVIVEIDLDAKLITDPVDTSTLGTNDTGHELLTNLEFGDLTGCCNQNIDTNTRENART